MKFPDYVKHIQHPTKVKAFWCATKWQREFVFTGLDHVSANALNKGRLLACPSCVETAVAALESWKWEAGSYPHVNRVDEICREIHKDTKFLSSIATDHPRYKELIQMGPEVVQALLHRLDCFPSEEGGEAWDGLAIWEPIAALQEITEANVIPEEDRGRLRPIIQHWLDWGEQQSIYTRIQWDD